MSRVGIDAFSAISESTVLESYIFILGKYLSFMKFTIIDLSNCPFLRMRVSVKLKEVQDLLTRISIVLVKINPFQHNVLFSYSSKVF